MLPTCPPRRKARLADSLAARGVSRADFGSIEFIEHSRCLDAIPGKVEIP